jgi:hypothetical protein
MVRLSCGVNFIRIVLLVSNILFVIFGFTLFGFGIYLKVSKKFDVALSEHINAKVLGGDAIEAVGVILIVVGLFTVLLSTFGCLGKFEYNESFSKKHIFLQRCFVKEQNTSVYIYGDSCPFNDYGIGSVYYNDELSCSCTR